MSANTTIGFNASNPVDGSRFYSDPACTSVITSTTMLAATSTASYYVKAVTGGNVIETVSAPFNSAMRTLAVLSAVRRGNCSFASPVGLSDGGTTFDYQTNCNISPSQLSLGHTALFFQATTSSSSSGVAKVRCHPSTTGNISCLRDGAGSSGQVHWQTLELPVGLRVERIDGTCASAPVFNLTVPTAVDPNMSFVLRSINSSGSDVDSEDLPTTRLISGSTVLFDDNLAAVDCAGLDYSVQVIELSGLTVTRGSEDAGIPIDAGSLAVGGLPPASLNVAMLTQNGADNGSPDICEVLVRGDMPSNTSLNFTRSAGVGGTCYQSPIPQIVWERLDFGARARVQTFTATLTGLTLDVVIAPVDTTRTIVFASSQDVAGQGCGETSGKVAHLTEGAARFELVNSTKVTVTRQHASGNGVFTFYVVEIDP